MAEPTLTEILDAINQVASRLNTIALTIDETKANLAQHRRDIDARTTQMDLAVRDEIGIVRGQVEVLTPMVEGVQAAQAAADLNATALATKIDAVAAKQDTIQTEVAVIAPKIEEVKTKQSLAEQATLDLSLKIDDLNTSLTTQPTEPVV